MTHKFLINKDIKFRMNLNMKVSLILTLILILIKTNYRILCKIEL